MDGYRKELCDWLSGFEWDTFFTITSRYREASPIRMLSHVCASLGTRTQRAFVASEYHPYGHGAHIHGIATLLLDAPNSRVWSWRELQELYTKSYGWSRFECIKTGFVPQYCTKYAIKSGDWDITGDWKHY